MCSAYSDNSSFRWRNRNTTAFAICLNAADHSPPVLTCRLDSATAKTTSAPPTCPFLSSLNWIKCIDERIWWRSTDSPRRILSHCDEGIPSGRLLATRRRALTPDKSSLNWKRVLQVSTQLPLLDELGDEICQGMSSSFTLFLMTRCNFFVFEFFSGYSIQEFLDFLSNSFSVCSLIGWESRFNMLGSFSGVGSILILDSSEGVDFCKVRVELLSFLFVVTNSIITRSHARLFLPCLFIFFHSDSL